MRKEKRGKEISYGSLCIKLTCMISGFDRSANETVALPGCYAGHCGNYVITDVVSLLGLLDSWRCTDRLSRNVDMWLPLFAA